MNVLNVTPLLFKKTIFATLFIMEFLFIFLLLNRTTQNVNVTSNRKMRLLHASVNIGQGIVLELSVNIPLLCKKALFNMKNSYLVCNISLHIFNNLIFITDLYERRLQALNFQIQRMF